MQQCMSPYKQNNTRDSPVYFYKLSVKMALSTIITSRQAPAVSRWRQGVVPVESVARGRLDGVALRRGQR